MVSRKAVRRSVPSGELPDFAPVPRKRPRHDGWTVERQRAFIAALADTGCVAIAARMVNMSKDGAYQLRRQPGAAGFRAAWDAAQTLGLQPVKDEAFDRAMNGQLVPVFVGGKLMGFRRIKNDRLLMFILRHYGQDAEGRRTTINYFSTRAGAAASSSPSRGDGEGDRASHGGGAIAEASTTTVKTVISGPGPGAGGPRDAEEAAATVLDAFEGVALDAEAQAEIYRALEACAARRRALDDAPEDDPERSFIGEREAGAYLGALESGIEDDWIDYRPEGEHLWENLGEGGEAEEIDAVLAGIEARKAEATPARIEAEQAEAAARTAAQTAEQRRLPPPEPDGDDPRLDWRNWSDGGYTPPSPHRGEGRGEGDADPSEPPPAKAAPKPRKPYKKRTPKPPFTQPDAARKAEAVADVAVERREDAAAAAERRRGRRKGGPEQQGSST